MDRDMPGWKSVWVSYSGDVVSWGVWNGSATRYLWDMFTFQANVERKGGKCHSVRYLTTHRTIFHLTNID